MYISKYFLILFADVEHSHVRLLGNLTLNLWDCGGQEAFMENYFVAQRDNIFRNVEVRSLYLFIHQTYPPKKQITPFKQIYLYTNIKYEENYFRS